MFDYWESLKPEDDIKNYVYDWVERNLQNYTGCMNVETLGSKIIECHLRTGDLDKFGNPELMQNIINVYAGREWAFHEKLAPFFLYPVWGKADTKYELNSAAIDLLCSKLDFVQIEDPNTYFENPVGGIRIALLGSYKKQDCISARESLCEYLHL